MAGIRKEDQRASEWVAWQAMVQVLRTNRVEGFDADNPATVVSAIVALIDERDELHEAVALQEVATTPNEPVYECLVRAFTSMAENHHMPYSASMEDLNTLDFRVLARGLADQLMGQWFGVS